MLFSTMPQLVSGPMRPVRTWKIQLGKRRPFGENPPGSRALGGDRAGVRGMSSFLSAVLCPKT